MKYLLNNEEVWIKKATPSRSKEIQLLHEEARSKSVILRGEREIRTLDFFIAQHNKRKIFASCGYKIWPQDGPEIIGLVCETNLRGNGIGSMLVELCLRRLLGRYSQVFTLTVAPKLFEKLGFRKISKQELTDKTCFDCLRCTQNRGIDPGDPRCNCTALAVTLNTWKSKCFSR